MPDDDQDGAGGGDLGFAFAAAAGDAGVAFAEEGGGAGASVLEEDPWLGRENGVSSWISEVRDCEVAVLSL